MRRDKDRLKLLNLADEIRRESHGWAAAQKLAGDLYESLGNETFSFDCYHAAYELEPDNVEIVHGYFQRLLRDKKYDDARDLLKRVSLLTDKSLQSAMLIDLQSREKAPDEELIATLQQLQQNARPGSGVFRQVFDQLRQTRSVAYSLKLISAWLETGAEHREIVDVWLAYCQERDQMRKARRFVGKITDASLRYYAHQKMLINLQKLNQLSSLKRYINRYAVDLAGDMRLRAITIKELRAANLPQEAVRFIESSGASIESIDEWREHVGLGLDLLDPERIASTLSETPPEVPEDDQNAYHVLFGDRDLESLDQCLEGEGALRECARIVQLNHASEDKKKIKLALRYLRRLKKGSGSTVDAFFAQHAMNRLTERTGVKLGWFG